MSYPGGSYPQAPGAYPAAGGGFPTPGYGQQPPYPSGAAGGLPYPNKPPELGFGGAPQPAYPGQAPVYPPQSGYPGQPPAQGGFPGQPPAQPGYPGQPPAQPGYPGQPPTQSGYPGQPPAQSGYPGQPPAQPGYPGQPPAQPGYAGQPPAQSGYGGQPPAQPGYGGQPPAQPGYGGQPPAQPPAQAGYPAQPPAQPGYAGQPPAQSGYAGQPQAQAGYGQPSAGGVPPTDSMRNMSIHQTGSYQAPHCEGTVKPYSPFNAEHDAGVIRKAMKGMGTDEKAIIDILCHRTNAQRQEIRKMFKTAYGKDIIKELRGELTGRFEDVIIGLMTPTAEYDASQLRKALEGAGTDEGCLIEILCTRTNAEINNIKAVYKTLFKRDLEKDLMSDTSGHFKRLMVSLVNAGRRENAPVDMARAKQDAGSLRQAGEGKLGTDESKFNQILCLNSHEQLRAIFNEYRNISSKSIEQAIKSEMSGDLERGMLAIVKVSQSRFGYFAERLYKSMKGAGTSDRTLVRVMVTRCEVDMVQIKQAFQATYGKTLENFIEGDTSGDYKKALLALCGRR